MLRSGGTPTSAIELIGMNKNGSHIACNARTREMSQNPTSWSRCVACHMENAVPANAMQMRYFACTKRPVTMPDSGINTMVTMPGRTQRQPRGAGIVAEYLLRHLRQQLRRRDQHEAQREHQHVADGKGRDAQQPDVHHRLAVVPLPHEQHRQRNHTERAPDVHERRAPAAFAFEPVEHDLQRAEAECDQREADVVHAQPVGEAACGAAPGSPVNPPRTGRPAAGSGSRTAG